MTRRPVYVAGPYGAPSPEGIARNIARALAVGQLAVAQGYAPVVPHVLGAWGLYGAADESDDGTARRVALECGVALAQTVALAGGELWGIALDSGSLSAGTAAEVHRWSLIRLRRSDAHAARILIWSTWASLCRDAGVELEGT